MKKTMNAFDVNRGEGGKEKGDTKKRPVKSGVEREIGNGSGSSRGEKT